ncbi:MAG: type II toxin-antitoxin system HicA family toxin [Candidatus Caenarcaniphilales bacterium]|nr:type II toxin-antitoxin system HicA family toxin [Candidatus Caenarcaniphilales bacterium]
MSQASKFIIKLLQGNSDGNISFDELCNLLKNLGFFSRIKGSHHIFWKSEIEEIINIQPKGNKAKSYQVKQIRNILIKYNLLKDFNLEGHE